jgi:3-deoxy-D-manno-octulosonate 8-phosphate phosphatase (KDO 8-P phosphatase)
MAQNYKSILKNIDTLIFDVDGVFTDNRVILIPGMEPVRTFSARDGYALQYAIKKGLRIVIITGGRSESVIERLQEFGIEHIYTSIQNKEEKLKSFIAENNSDPEKILYMGDDIPDLRVMLMVALACCPQDAVNEIKNICNYVSPIKGGQGCVRDIIEQTLKVQGKWMEHDAHEW